MIKALDRLLEKISRFVLLLGGILILLMAFVTTYGVIRRYVFHNPEHYTVEISVIFLIWSFVLAAAYVERKDQHIRVDILSQLMPKSVQHLLLNVFVPIAGLIFVGMITWRSWLNALYSLSISEVSSSIWAVPLFPIKVVIPIGYGLLCVVLLLKLLIGIVTFADSFSSENADDQYTHSE